jgi:NADP-dependent 3-hydroxy acid dehydrogenase YdfG
MNDRSILVNNAGALYGRPTHAIDFAEYWRTVEINYKAVCPALSLPSHILTCQFSQ